MPSGARKRKAAKKKKEQQANSNSLPINGDNPQGHDDTKSQEDRGSDGGEVDSPVSQDSQSHQDSFSANTEENGKLDTSTDHSMDAERTADEVKKEYLTTELLGNGDGVDIKIEKAMEPEDESWGRSDKVPIIDDSHRSSSSNSSSDDESQLSAKNVEEQVYKHASEAALYNIENKMDCSMSGKAVPVTESSSVLESDYHSAVETAPHGDSVKPVSSMSKEVVHATEYSTLTAPASSDLLESGRKVNEETVPNSSISTGVQSEGNNFPTSDTVAFESNEIAKETKETRIPVPTEKEVVAGFAPSVRRRTSVFSCCGLFDVFSSPEK